jgi:hypothetical protein
VKNRLAKERAVLIKDGAPTLKLRLVLRQIFLWYSERNSDTVLGHGTNFDEATWDDVRLNQLMASRLWYRCGMKLASLESILAAKKESTVCFQDFFRLIEQIVEEDENDMQLSRQAQSYMTIPELTFEVCRYNRRIENLSMLLSMCPHICFLFSLF